MGEDDVLLFQGPNPYNFRDPIKDPTRLVGRERELAEIEKNFETAASGGTGHMALIGDRAAGKTSLLNGAAGVARRMRLLPVRLDLDSALVASSPIFFFALIEAAVEALVRAEKERLGSEGSAAAPSLGWYHAWRSRCYGGDRDSVFPEERLNFALVQAAALSGLTPEDVGPALLLHDFDELKAIGSAAGWSGFAVLIDEANVLGREVALLEKLRNLVQATQGWTLVLAGTKDLFSHVGDVFSPIPRQFDHISVAGYLSSNQVRDCITAPLPADALQELAISYDVAVDILRLTQGEPYEITLVAHHMWETARDRGKEEFVPSTLVLDRVLRDLSTIGRHEEHEQQIEAVRNLSPRNLRTAMNIIPFERMTVREIALTRLMPRDFSAEELDEAERVVKTDLHELKELGLIEWQGDEAWTADRFTVKGGSFVRIYLKYAAIAYLGTEAAEEVWFGAPFLLQATMSLSPQLEMDVVSDPESAPAVFGVHVILFDENQSAEYRIDELATGLDSGDFPRLKNTVLGVRNDPEQFETVQQHGLLALGWVCEHGLDQAEFFTIRPNVQDVDPEVLEERLGDAIDRSAPLLEKYGVSVTRTISRAVEPAVSAHLVAQLSPETLVTVLLNRFQAHDIDGAIRVAELACESLDQHRVTDPDEYRKLVADFSNRLGFLRITKGLYAEAIEPLERALELVDDGLIERVNIAYAHAAVGDYESAIRCYGEALRRIDRHRPSRTWLLFFVPPAPGWEPLSSEWNIVVVNTPDELGALLRAEVALLNAVLNGAESSDSLAELDALPDTVGARRIAGWAHALLGGSQQVCREHFARARDMLVEAPEHVDHEAEFALGLFEQRSLPT